MSSKNKVFQKIDPKNPNAAPKYYPEFMSKDVVNIHDLAQEIADNTGVSPNDVHEIIDKMSNVLDDILSDSKYDELQFTTGTGLQKKVWPLILTKKEKPN